MNENPDRQNADQARISLARQARMKQPGQEEERSTNEPVREDLEDNTEKKPPINLARRPVPLTPKPDSTARDLKMLNPPTLTHRTHPVSNEGGSGMRRLSESPHRPAGSRFEPSAGAAPLPRNEVKTAAPAPISLPTGVQRGFPRQQPGANGGTREQRPPLPAPVRPGTIVEPVYKGPIPEAGKAVEEKRGEEHPAEIVDVRPEKTNERPKTEFFLEDILDRLANPPAQTALLGVCDDELPVLIDLNDPAPGAILVISDDDLLRTRLLRTLVQTSAALNSPRSVQFIVFSAHPEEWQAWIEDQEILRHCLGVERLPEHGENQTVEGSPDRWLLKLSGWADQRRSGGVSGPAVILVVDDLVAATEMEYDARVNFDWLVKEGPAVGIWPVVGLKTIRAKNFTRWVRLFKTRLLGPAEDATLIKQLSADSEVQVEPAQFAVRVQDTWLKFRVPILPNETD